MTTEKRNFISYGFVAMLSMVLLLWVIPEFSPEYPGYGMPATRVPNIAAGAMLLFSGIGILQTFLQAGKNRTEKSVVSIRWAYLAVLIISCLLLMPAMHHIGFMVSGIVFLLFVQWICGQRALLPLVLVSVLPVVFVYVLMRYGLGVPLP